MGGGCIFSYMRKRTLAMGGFGFFLVSFSFYGYTSGRV